MNNITVEKYSNGKIKKLTLLYNDGINPEKYIEEFDKNGFTIRIIKQYPDCKEYNISITNKNNITYLNDNVIIKYGKNNYQDIFLINCNLVISNCCNNSSFKLYDFDSGNTTYYKENKKYLTICNGIDSINDFGKSLEYNNKIYWYNCGKKKYKEILYDKTVIKYTGDKTISEIKFSDCTHAFYYYKFNQIDYYKNNKMYRQLRNYYKI